MKLLYLFEKKTENGEESFYIIDLVDHDAFYPWIRLQQELVFNVVRKAVLDCCPGDNNCNNCCTKLELVMEIWIDILKRCESQAELN